MKIVFGYDGSEYADGAMEDLRNAGLPDNTESTLLCAADVFHVFEATDAGGGNQTVMAEAAARWRAGVDAAVAAARQIAETGVAKMRRLYPSWKITPEAVADSPSWALIQRGEGMGDPTRKVDMIVVGAAGHSALGRLLFGSVANQVLSNADCPVRVGRRSTRGANETLRLLVGVDGSAESRLAVDRIASRSWPKGTECRVVAVIDSRLSTAFPPFVPFVASSPEALARGIVADAQKQLEAAGLRTTSVVQFGGAVANLLREAGEYRAHGIFVGASGLGRMARVMLGSVSRSVSLHATCSVEVVRGSATSP